MPFSEVYEDHALVEELRRVAALIREGPVTRDLFSAHSAISPVTMLRRFGSWGDALAAAGLEDRYSGQLVTAKMRTHRARAMTDNEILDEIRRVAGSVDGPLTLKLVQQKSPLLGGGVLTTRFGSWRAAAEAAGLTLSKMANRWTDQELRDNLATVICHHGREPTAAEMRRPPSLVSAETYRHRYGTWPRALKELTASRSSSNDPQRSDQEVSSWPVSVGESTLSSSATSSQVPNRRR